MKTVKEVSESLNVSKQTIHYHLKNLPSNLKVKKTGNKSLIDDSIIAYLESILNKKTTKESTNKSSSFDEKSTKESTNKKQPDNASHDSYVDKYITELFLPLHDLICILAVLHGKADDISRPVDTAIIPVHFMNHLGCHEDYGGTPEPFQL